MYMNRMLSIGQAENGYVVECRARIKPEKKKKVSALVAEYPGSKEKQFIAADAAEVITIVQTLLPMLDETYTTEDEFDAAFEDAAA